MDFTTNLYTVAFLTEERISVTNGLFVCVGGGGGGGGGGECKSSTMSIQIFHSLFFSI